MIKKVQAIVLWVILPVISSLFLIMCSCSREDTDKCGNLVVRTDKKRISPGDTVFVTVESPLPVRAKDISLFITDPGIGTKELKLNQQNDRSDVFHAIIEPGLSKSDGLRIITAVSGGKNRIMTGKAAYLSGNIIADYAIMINFPDSACQYSMQDYLKQFTGIGGNMIILHANIGAEKVRDGTVEIKAVWPSVICKASASPDKDRIDMMLNITDSLGIAAMISVSWDLSDPNLRNSEYMHSIDAIISEQWKKYAHHSSLAGFYSLQEGSGTYYAAYVREFCASVKKHGEGILTMCAPNIDDPLLAGYLASIKDLDIINYQAPVMTSYRPDNRQMYPNSRVRDITSLSSGATRIADKITMSHVEFMGYLENNVGNAYLTSYKNIFNQFPAAATAYGPDGISFFSYFSCIYSNKRALPAETDVAEKAVIDGLKAYNIIKNNISTEPSHLAVYIPYSDWCIERWQNCITPALDALRQIGISYDVIPFIPKKGEEILPFYPMNRNTVQEEYLFSNKYVVILPDISGMQETDSEMLEDFVNNGGVVIAFGPRIPYGDRFIREKLWGAKEIIPIQALQKFESISVVKNGRRTRKDQSWSFPPSVSTAWLPATADVMAAFPGGNASVFSNRYGKGKTYVVTISARNAANAFPDLIRDVIDDALNEYNIKRPFDIYGACQSMDVAMKTGRTDSFISVTNYLSTSVELKIRPLNLTSDKEYFLTDLKSGTLVSKKSGSEYTSIPVRVEANNYVAFSFEPAEKEQ